VPTWVGRDLRGAHRAGRADDEDLARLIVYDTSGTTGHALPVPFHPRTVALAHAFAGLALERHGAAFDPREGEVACVNLCAQVETFVFAVSFSVWDHALFAKVNLHPGHWAGGPEAARRWFARVRPQLVTGDPTSFAEAMRWDLPLAPRALLSTATALEPAFARELAARWRCPVIDVYSTTETGPIAGSVPDGGGLRILSDDLYVEVVDARGLPVPLGTRGEVTVTGGRNPYVPLLRYRTGDTARLVAPPASSPDPRPPPRRPRRAPRALASRHRRCRSPVDVGRLLRLHPRS
jgi:phenylacetate-CoA ligase